MHTQGSLDSLLTQFKYIYENLRDNKYKSLKDASNMTRRSVHYLIWSKISHVTVPFIDVTN